MKVYSIAMAEVKKDLVLCGSDACLEWDDAVDAADEFMMRCVCDFYETGNRTLARKMIEERVSRETSVFHGERRLECTYRDPDKEYVVTTCVHEREV